jgi:hypothetical protein
MYPCRRIVFAACLAGIRLVDHVPHVHHGLDRHHHPDVGCYGFVAST